MRKVLRVFVGAPFVLVWFLMLWLAYPCIVCVVFAVDNEFVSPREYWKEMRNRWKV